MFNKLTRSLLLTAAVSAVLAWPVTYFGIGFVSAFCFFTTLQFVVFFFYSTNLETRALETAKRLEIQRDIEFSRQFASVTCPCDSRVNSEIPLFMGEENTYECPGCNKTINVNIQLKTYLQTTPMNETPDQIINKAIANAPNQ